MPAPKILVVEDDPFTRIVALLLDPAAAERIKPGACMVNVSRADAVDRTALIAAFKVGTARRLLRSIGSARSRGAATMSFYASITLCSFRTSRRSRGGMRSTISPI